MFGSDVPRWRAVVVLLLGAFASCDDPTRPRVAPEVTQLGLLMILEPGRPTQPLVIQQKFGQPRIPLTAVVRSPSGIVAEAASADTTQRENMDPCYRRFPTPAVQVPWQTRCLVLGFSAQATETYAVSVTSPGRPVVTATTTVPGDFAIVSHTLRGPTAGPLELKAVWTKSARVYRYVVALGGEPTDMPSCQSESLCHSRWFAVTEDTTISAAIDAKYLEASRGPYHVTVYAMSRELYGYVFTGTSGTYFPVPPAQYVQGGLGAVGAVVRRGAVTDTNVTAQRLADGIRMRNDGDEEIGVIPWDLTQGVGAVWTCENHPQSCIKVPPRSTVLIPNDQIAGYSAETQHIVVRFWLPGDREDGGHQFLLHF